MRAWADCEHVPDHRLNERSLPVNRLAVQPFARVLPVALQGMALQNNVLDVAAARGEPLQDLIAVLDHLWRRGAILQLERQACHVVAKALP